MPIHLPGFGGEATVRSGRIAASIGGETSDTWTAPFELQELVTPTINAEQATIAASGIAANMADPDAHQVTFEVNGLAEPPLELKHRHQDRLGDDHARLAHPLIAGVQDEIGEGSDRRRSAKGLEARVQGLVDVGAARLGIGPQPSRRKR